MFLHSHIFENHTKKMSRLLSRPKIYILLNKLITGTCKKKDSKESLLRLLNASLFWKKTKLIHPCITHSKNVSKAAKNRDRPM